MDSTNNIEILLLWCSGQHAILAEAYGSFADCYPVEFFGDIPHWLPTEFQSLYKEALRALATGMYSSACAICGIMLEVRVNELISEYKGDTTTLIKNPDKKPLHQKLEFLIGKGKIDAGQFSDAIITKLARNEVLHPTDLEIVSIDDATNALEAVTSFLEKEFKFSPAKALPVAS